MITKEEFTELYHASITRRGADKLLDWMGKADFFTAPASTRYHLACKGGLMEHSVHVYRRLQRLWPPSIRRTALIPTRRWR